MTNEEIEYKISANKISLYDKLNKTLPIEGVPLPGSISVQETSDYLDKIEKTFDLTDSYPDSEAKAEDDFDSMLFTLEEKVGLSTKEILDKYSDKYDLSEYQAEYEKMMSSKEAKDQRVAKAQKNKKAESTFKMLSDLQDEQLAEDQVEKEIKTLISQHLDKAEAILRNSKNIDNLVDFSPLRDSDEVTHEYKVDQLLNSEPVRVPLPVPRIHSSEFSFFKMLGDMFGFETLSDEEKKYRKMVLSLISNKMFARVLEIKDAGYTFDKKLEETFNTNLTNFINNEPDNAIELFESLAKQKTNIEDQYLTKLSFSKDGINFIGMTFNYIQHSASGKKSNFPRIIKESTTNHTWAKDFCASYPALSKLYIEKIHTPAFRRSLFLSWQVVLIKAAQIKPEEYLKTDNNGKEIDRDMTTVQKSKNMLSLILTGASKDDHFECINICNDAILAINSLEKKMNYNNSRLYQVVEKRKSYESIITSISMSLKHGIGAFEEKQLEKTNAKPLTFSEKVLLLPVESQDVITNLFTLHNKTKQNEEHVADLIQYDIENIFTNRLPEVVDKYLSIDPEYRNDFKNTQGKTATELMQESLGNFEDTLKSIMKNVNESKLSSLSATQRYTSDLKNGYVSPTQNLVVDPVAQLSAENDKAENLKEMNGEEMNPRMKKDKSSIVLKIREDAEKQMFKNKNIRI